VYSITKKTISVVHVHVSPGSAEKLVRRGGIANHHLIAHSLGNICAKTHQNRLMCIEVIVCNNISVVFFETQCTVYGLTSHSILQITSKTIFAANCWTAAGTSRPNLAAIKLQYRNLRNCYKNLLTYTKLTLMKLQSIFVSSYAVWPGTTHCDSVSPWLSELIRFLSHSTR